MDSPIEYWEDVVDIADTTVADFDGRNTSMNVYDTDSIYRTIVQEIGEVSNTKQSIAADFTFRVFIAHVSDITDEGDVRDMYDQTRLVPPKGWVSDHKDDLPTVDMTVEPSRIESENKRQFTFQTGPTVHAMAGEIIERDDRWDSYNQFVQDAILFAYNEYDSDSVVFEVDPVVA